MCGLFGWQFNPDAPVVLDTKVLAAVLSISAESRGSDSWGVVTYDFKTDPVIHKAIGAIGMTLDQHHLWQLQVLGHTRHATVGGISQENSHPFVSETIIGMHNGGVSNWKEMNTKHKRSHEVDSMHIFSHLAEKRPLTDLDAYGTVVYLDTDDPARVFLGAGHQFSLAVASIGPTDAPYGLVWHSTEYALKEALKYASCREYELYDIDSRQLYYTENFLLYSGEAFDLKSTPYVTHYQPIKTTNREEYENRYKDIDWRTVYENPPGYLGVIDRSLVNNLPESLKKSQEVYGLARGEDSQASSAIQACDGCRCDGIAVDDYEDDTHGVIWYDHPGEYLCFTCAAEWGTTTRSLPPPVIHVPELRLNLETEKRRIGICYGDD